RRANNAAAALGAVKTSAARAAFAPKGHPAAGELAVLAEGGRLPVAVFAVVNAGAVPAGMRDQLTQAMVGGAGVGGGIRGWQAGSGEALGQARSLAKAAPKATSTAALLAASAQGTLAPPPLRLRVETKLPEPAIAHDVNVPATLDLGD